jgi:RNA polymerase sigma-70 factor (ECF subfamily)
VAGGDDLREIYAKCLMRLCANDMGVLRAFDPGRGTQLSTWIGTVAGSCAHDHLRSLRRDIERAPLDDIEDVIEDAPSPDEILEEKERREAAAAMLAELSEKDREFVSLYFDEGLCADEIAERLHISVKTVYSKKHKIQSRLEARLAQEERLAA